jgi:hypothetical protein
MFRWRTVWPQTSDEEHIERIRRLLLRLECWRPWLVALYATCLVAFVWVSLMAGELMRRFAADPALGPALRLGWWLGVFLGSTIGGLFVMTGHGLATALFVGRNERLLVRYYDAWRALQAPTQRETE